ncbi:MAG: hypothetical protein ACI9JN_002905 [Bacteroidia bacterium]
MVFDQGQDILQNLSFTGDFETIRQTWFVFFAISWWSWQTFRSSRGILHFTYFNFYTYLPAYSLRAQVFVPRMLASLPFLILALAVYRTDNGMTAFSLLLISSAIWIFVFLHFRKSFIVRLRSWKTFIPKLIPDYIPIKNGTYPASFIWAKQRSWFLFRIVVVIAFFLLFYYNPVRFPQYLGSATVVLLGFSTWLILASIITFIEKFLRFPVSFSILLMVITFSFFNNNHTVRTIDAPMPNRTVLSEHFDTWAKTHKADTDSINVFLVMAEGGGLRSAYWTTSLLNSLSTIDTSFSNHVYGYSCVSGGALGTMMFNTTESDKTLNPTHVMAPNLNSDLLAPVTSALIFTDLLQKFIPFPIKRLDRSRILEKSFEQSLPSDTIWQKGFLKEYSKPEKPVIIINGTHVESGKRTLISNVDISEIKENQNQDFFDVTEQDVSISTAIGVGSRFPFITPPALLKNKDGSTWGNVVDGGYYENLGMQTMLDIYSIIKPIAVENNYKIKFTFIAIRNTKSDDHNRPVLGMVEALAPAITFANIWGNNSNEVLGNGGKLIETNQDDLFVLSLQRTDNENIPLGWYLSPRARQNLNRQLLAIPDSTYSAILK